MHPCPVCQMTTLTHNCITASLPEQQNRVQIFSEVAFHEKQFKFPHHTLTADSRMFSNVPSRCAPTPAPPFLNLENVRGGLIESYVFLPVLIWFVPELGKQRLPGRRVLIESWASLGGAQKSCSAHHRKTQLISTWFLSNVNSLTLFGQRKQVQLRLLGYTLTDFCHSSLSALTCTLIFHDSSEDDSVPNLMCQQHNLDRYF